MTARSHSRSRKRQKRSLSALRRREDLRLASRRRPTRVPGWGYARTLLMTVPSVVGNSWEDPSPREEDG